MNSAAVPHGYYWTLWGRRAATGYQGPAYKDALATRTAASLSTTQNAASMPASKCIDGVNDGTFSNIGSGFCHSAGNGDAGTTNPWLSVQV